MTTPDPRRPGDGDEQTSFVPRSPGPGGSDEQTSFVPRNAAPGGPDEQTSFVQRNPGPGWAGGPDEQTSFVARNPDPYPGQYGGSPYGGPPPQAYPADQPYHAPAYPPPSQPYPAPYPEQQYGPPRTAAYAYNPYGDEQFPAVDAYPGGDPVPPPRRPGSMAFALLLHVLSAAPYLAVAGLVVAASATVLAQIPPEVLAEAQAGGTDIAGLLQVLTTYLAVLGGVIGVVALLFLLFAGFAFAGRGWARILVTLMTVVFVLLAGLWVFAVIGGAGLAEVTADPATLGVVLAILVGPAVLALLGTILLFTRGANRFFGRR